MQTPLFGQLLKIGFFAVAIVGVGCSAFRSGDQDSSSIKDLLVAPDPPDFIGDAAVPFGLTYARVQGVGAVKGLNRTGGPALPSEQRDRLLAEMRTHDVAQPEKYLESERTAMVVTETVLPPGLKKGTRLDAMIQTPPRSQVSSLQNGWLMPARMQEMRRLEGSIKTSDVAAIGTGAVVVRGIHAGNGADEMMLEGVILGGAVAQINRPVGLVIRPKYQHVLLSAQFAKAINKRFYFYDGSTRRGIATAREDDFVQIEVPPRYEANVHRLLAVVRAVHVKRGDGGLRVLLDELSKQMGEPTTAAEAALALEALGDDGVPVLIAALSKNDKELRFYAAEALAYLDREEAIEPLIELARDESAFRYACFKALEGMPQISVNDALFGLMDQSSNEVRYGAFVTLRERPSARSMIGGQRFGDGYFVHALPSKGETLIACSLTKRPEIVVFGTETRIDLKESTVSRGGIVIREESPGKLKLSRFYADQPDRSATASNNIVSLCMAVADMGGTYSDCLDLLRTLKSEKAIAARLAFDPLPRPLRTYYRDGEAADEPTGKRESLGPTDISPEPPATKSLLDRMQWWKSEP